MFEVVETLLPDVLRSALEEFGLGGVAPTTHLDQDASRKSQLQSLHDSGGSAFLRFADQKVKVFEHDDVSDDDELILFPDPLQYLEKQVAPLSGSEQRLSAVTTTRDEMQFVVAVITREIPGHVG